MLESNHLNPPQSYRVPTAPAPASAAALNRQVFVSAEDFDTTGILAGCDPCASNYWWMPELHTAAPADLTVATSADAGAAIHATRRSAERPQAAA